jgi:hypothetical protein
MKAASLIFPRESLKIKTTNEIGSHFGVLSLVEAGTKSTTERMTDEKEKNLK